ncbi:HNH endonuclease [Streptomyces sp. NBC_01020]|nr:HNH endonuclease [Streptomyces sp. NBC_01020]
MESKKLSPRGRIDALAVLERHAAWFAARQVHLLADIAAHAESAPPSSERDIDTQLLNNGDYATEEVACALRISNATATERLQIAKELAGHYANTLGLLEGGEICYMQARNLANACRVLEPKAAARVETAMATRMPTQATGQSSRALRRQVIKADPEGYQRRLELRTKEREIVRYPQDDGMITWGATVPADLGARFDQAVDAHATTLVVDGRTLSQRRVDALADLILNRPALPSGSSASAESEAPQGLSRRPTTALVHVTVPLDVLIGVSEDPAELKGYGPITATQARTIAFAEGTIWRRLITHPKTGLLIKTDPATYSPTAEAERHVIARDQQCAFPSCRMPAQRCDLDHVKEFDHDHPESGGKTVPENLIPICRRHHLMKHRGNWTVTRDAVTGITTWVSPTGHIYLNTPRNYAE